MTKTMLLIDADNVSTDVMEQAVQALMLEHGALHVRRAYCTAESAVANQAAFKRLGIKPMVNLAAGKNSTDIALAVDAIDLVLAERPDVVVIASSDSDFAPLVHRLREKGCVVRGVGQLGKVGDETQDVYDDFTVLEHHKSSPGPSSQAAAKTAARKTPARKAAARTTTAAKSAAAKKAPAAKKVAAKKAAAKSTPRKSAARKTAAAAPPDVLPEAPVAPPAPAQTPGPAKATEAQSGRSPVSVQAVLDCLPELSAGKSLAMNVAVQRLREAQLLGRNTTSSKLFAQLSHVIELLPPGKPTQLRLRAG
jgi:uncharacterized protein (TIGR00288 family)